MEWGGYGGFLNDVDERCGIVVVWFGLKVNCFSRKIVVFLLEISFCFCFVGGGSKGMVLVGFRCWW